MAVFFVYKLQNKICESGIKNPIFYGQPLGQPIDS